MFLRKREKFPIFTGKKNAFNGHYSLTLRVVSLYNLNRISSLLTFMYRAF